jgi:hypothetical protein
MKKTVENKPPVQKGAYKISLPFNTTFPGKFTCGNGPDEEPDCFDNTVRGFLKKGQSETKAKRIAEACFKALAKL